MTSTTKKHIDEEISHNAAELIRALRSVARDAENEAARLERSDVKNVWVDGHMASNMASMLVPRIVRLAGAIGKREALDLIEVLDAQ